MGGSKVEIAEGVQVLAMNVVKHGIRYISVLVLQIKEEKGVLKVKQLKGGSIRCFLEFNKEVVH